MLVVIVDAVGQVGLVWSAVQEQDVEAQEEFQPLF